MKKFLQVTILSAIYTFFKMIAGFVIGKFVAVYTGPTGIAMLGQVQSLMTILTGITTAPVSTGLVRYTAENWSNGEKACAPWWSACFKVTALFTFLIIPLVILFSSKLSTLLFDDKTYIWVIVFACCILPFSIFNTLISSVLNGQQRYKQYILLGMLSVFVSTIVMSLLIFSFNLKGALVATALNSGVAGLVLICFCLNKSWFRIKYWWGETDGEKIFQIIKYTLMALTAVISMPVALLLIRKILIAKTGWESAGQWQAVWKISEIYLGVVTIALSTYFLPRLAILKNSVLIRNEINSTIFYVLFVTTCMGLGIYFLRDEIISILFTEKFRMARELFLLQLTGDVIKVAGFLYSYTLQAQGHSKIFISSELIFSLIFVIASYYLINIFGVQGANVSYLITYVMYFFFAFVFTNHFNVRNEKSR
ncbi:O-antigen translocase [Buttiauxella agrestis]|uniref:WzxE family protein n=1 Tax=Buttiauxella agrestis ATCC 33320 TaxID=1006004 RepID=A0A085GB63_9ENTR|nr:O-antigen translocase [Buttiauxella agrestis]KFC80958.1 WzxE family protein [Buttiauxella agrestis ATCC 33320]